MMNTALKRILAYVLDGLIIGVVSSLFDSLMTPFLSPVSFDWLGIAIVLNVEFLLLFYLLYFILFDVLNNGITVGKAITGIRVVVDEPGSITTKQHILRTLLKMISVLFSFIAFIVFILTPQWTLHDSVMNTITVSKQPSNSISEE
tara:strand:+ start:44337 stop:44774 length:438 start_codon:yes stop_codon:yes gene_type:complete